MSVKILVPLWVLLLMVVGLLPLLFQSLKWLKGKGLVKDKDIVIGGEMKTIAPASIQVEKKNKRVNEVKILKLLAKGDKGVLLQSLADSLDIDSNTTNHALKYLIGKNMVEVVNAMGGDKYFLTKVGKSYCSKKGYITTAA
ncbi:MAG: hypothetical protein P8Y24_13360 [Gammaproteobacteria bacterium]